MTIPVIETVETLYSGWGRYLQAAIRMPDGTRIRREIEDHGQAAGVLAFDPDRRTAMLVRQLRAPMLHAAGEVDSLEIIAGLLDEDDAAVCVRREADEEAGLRLREVELVVIAHPMPGISTERIHLYLGTYGAGDRTGAGGGVASETESITVVEMPLAELADMADHGRLVDEKTMLLVQTLRLKRPDLFHSEP